MTGNTAYEKKKKDSTILAIEKEEISSINVRDTDREINTIPELSRARALLGYPLTSHGLQPPRVDKLAATFLPWDEIKIENVGVLSISRRRE